MTMDFAFATVVTIAPIKAGEELTKQNLWVKRPGTGSIPAEQYEVAARQEGVARSAADVHLSADAERLQPSPAAARSRRSSAIAPAPAASADADRLAPVHPAAVIALDVGDRIVGHGRPRLPAAACSSSPAPPVSSTRINVPLTRLPSSVWIFTFDPSGIASATLRHCCASWANALPAVSVNNETMRAIADGTHDDLLSRNRFQIRRSG